MRSVLHITLAYVYSSQCDSAAASSLSFVFYLRCALARWRHSLLDAFPELLVGHHDSHELLMAHSATGLGALGEGGSLYPADCTVMGSSLAFPLGGSLQLDHRRSAQRPGFGFGGESPFAPRDVAFLERHLEGKLARGGLLRRQEAEDLALFAALLSLLVITRASR